MSNHSESTRGIFLAVAGVLILSPDSLLIRLIHADDWTLIFWRGLLMGSAVVTFTVLRYRRHAVARLRAVGGAGVFAGALFAGSATLFVLSIRLTTVANALVIVAAAPLFSAALSRLFLRERVPAGTWVAVCVVLGGLYLIFRASVGGSTLAGDVCAVGTALCVGGNLVVIRYARRVDMLPSLALGGLITAAAMLPFCSPLDIDPADTVLIPVLGLLVLPLSFGLLTVAPRYLPAPEVGLITLLESVLGPLWVWLALGEVPAPETFLGGGLILGTLAVHLALRLRAGAGSGVRGSGVQGWRMAREPGTRVRGAPEGADAATRKTHKP